MRIPKPGDLIEMRTALGLAYAQVTHKVPLFGTLIRVLEPIVPERPSDLDAIATSRERFVTFFPVAAALNRGMVRFAGSASIPPHAQKFPLLRQRGKVLASGVVADWWLYDGSRQWRIGRLAPDQARLSIAEVVNDTLLRERIDSDWRPEQVA
jgi:hypothetical protein